MKTARWIALAALLSTSAVACAAQTQPDDNRGAQRSGVSARPDEPPPPADDSSPTPAPTPAPESADTCAPLPTHTPGTGAGGGAGNPASLYCVDLGYQLDGETCAFDDGTACEQWSFYRGECGQAHSFCNLHGGSIANKIEDMGGWTASYAVCTFRDGSACQEDEFAHACACN